MRKPLALFAAASLSAGVFAYIGYDSAAFAKDDQQKAADTSGAGSGLGTSGSGQKSSASASGRASLPQGTQRADQSDEAGIRATLRQVTIAALKDDSLSDLTNYFASSDRMKLRALAQDNAQIKDKLQQLRKDFKAKYNTDFEPDEMVFGKAYDTLIIVQGEVVNPALMSNWPVDSSGKAGSTSGGTGSSNLRSDTSGTSSGLSGSSSSSGGIGASSSTDRNTPSRSTDKNSNSATGTDRSSSSSSSGTGISGSSSSSSGSGLSGSSSTSGTGAASSMGVQKGYGVAIVTFPATELAPEAIVSLVRESSAAGGAPGAAGSSGSSTGTGSNTGAGSSNSSPRSDASSTSGIGGSSSSASGAAGTSSSADRSSSSSSASPDRFGTSSSGAGSATADRSSTPGSSSTADRSTTSGGLNSSGRTTASGQAGASDWKVKLPDNITADQLQKNLAKHIDEACQAKDKWPADKTEGYRTVAQHIFAAFYDVSPGGAGGAGTGTGLDTPPIRQ
ncbi:MAG TPA: hypothetical protein VGQ99_17855 [Tepidisphaeraceae bacterium]|jgi:hypothetical protein|nr:hypothetical protein [Tepidisphaeraceae bacterium]